MIRPLNNQHLTSGFVFLLFAALLGHAQSQKLTGQVFAYNPWSHLFKVPSSVENQEVVIFKLRYRPSFVKLVLTSFGQEQLEHRYPNDGTTIAVRAVRDSGCDEDSPKFLGKGEPLVPPDADKTPGAHEVKLEQKYQLAGFFSKEPIPRIEHLDCYRVEMPRK